MRVCLFQKGCFSNDKRDGNENEKIQLGPVYMEVGDPR